MTDAQVRARALSETIRHNLAQEVNWRKTLQETERSNKAKEGLTKYSTDVQAATSRYATETQAETSRYATEVNASTQIANAQLAAETSRYATDVSAQTSVYRTDIESADRQARLEFDERTQEFKNNLENRRYALQRLQTMTDLKMKQKEMEKIANDISINLEKLELEARRVGLQEKAQKFDNLLKVAQTVETGTKSVKNITSIAQDAAALFKILGAIGGI